MALKCTNTSPPSSFSIKPNPFFSLNHFTFPSAKFVHPPFLRFFRVGLRSGAQKKPPLFRNAPGNGSGSNVLQDMKAQLFPTPPQFISREPASVRLRGRMMVRSIVFFKNQVIFCSLALLLSPA